MSKHRYGEPKKLSFKDVQGRLRAAGMTITRDTVLSGPTGSGEYRVTFSKSDERWPWDLRKRAEAVSAYTDDLDDALRTGLAMARTQTTPGYKLLPGESIALVASQSAAADRWHEEDMRNMPGPDDPMWKK